MFQDIFSLQFSINTYNYNRQNMLLGSHLFDGFTGKKKIDDSTWSISAETKEIEGVDKGYELTCTLVCESGILNEAAVSACLQFDNWSEKNYVFLPAAAYNGNRYESRPQPYMPFFYNFEDMSAVPKILLSDVPRLNSDAGYSKIQERSGSLSTPAIGFFSEEQNKSFLLLTDQGTPFGDHGISIEETRDRKTAFITLTNPVVRELFQYNMTNTRYCSMDKPANFKEGDKVVLKFKIFSFACKSVQELFNFYNHERYNIQLPSEKISVLPYSEAFNTIEEKFNRQNYVEQYGYYAVGMQENPCQDWQIGWVGGMISTFPLLMDGNKLTRERVLNNFNWLFQYGISPGGLFWGIGEKGTRFFGEFEHSKPLGKDLILVRKIGDAIYYIIKQFMLMEKMGIEVKENWKQKLKGVTETLISVWHNNMQLGQYLNIHTNKIVVGGSTSGGIVPAALCLASNYYEDSEYLERAKDISLHFYEKYVQKGITYGGVGDAMHNFDSESSYGLLESYILLYEHTKDNKWLNIAGEMANQFATWVISYDYKFPEDSLFGELKMQTRGTVFANTQNKHLAPGICTHSGIALLRLFRATGNIFYINLLRDIVRTIPQYLAHRKRPIPGMQDGWMSERVNSTDWWEPIGEIFCGSTWSETSCMLSYAEIPGIYCIPSKSIFLALDNIDILIENETENLVELKICNNTDFKASVKIMIESEKSIQKPLYENALFECEIIEIERNNTIIKKITK